MRNYNDAPITKTSNMGTETIISWTKSVRDKDRTQTLIVDKVENGFIITIEKSGNEGEGEKRKWVQESKRFISAENPFEKEETDDSTDEKGTDGNSVKKMVSSAIDAIGGLNGLLSV